MLSIRSTLRPEAAVLSGLLAVVILTTDYVVAVAQLGWPPATAPAADDDAALLRAARMRQRDALRQVLEAVQSAYETGLVAHDVVCDCRKRLMDVELDLAKTPAERIAVCRAMVDDALGFERMTYALHSAGARGGDTATMRQVRAARLGCETRLIEELIKAKRPGDGPVVLVPRCNPKDRSTIAEIERLGGRVVVDEKRPDLPVVSVSFSVRGALMTLDILSGADAKAQQPAPDLFRRESPGPAPPPSAAWPISPRFPRPVAPPPGPGEPGPPEKIPEPAPPPPLVTEPTPAVRPPFEPTPAVRPPSEPSPTVPLPPSDPRPQTPPAPAGDDEPPLDREMVGVAIPQQTMQRIAQLRELRWLDFSGVPVTDAQLTSLVGLGKLEVLRLSGKKVTIAGIKTLYPQPLGRLKTLDLRGTSLGEADVASLQKMLPRVRILRLPPRASPAPPPLPDGR